MVMLKHILKQVTRSDPLLLSLVEFPTSHSGRQKVPVRTFHYKEQTSAITSAKIQENLVSVYRDLVYQHLTALVQSSCEYTVLDAIVQGRHSLAPHTRWAGMPSLIRDLVQRVPTHSPYPEVLASALLAKRYPDVLFQFEEHAAIRIRPPNLVWGGRDKKWTLHVYQDSQWDWGKSRAFLIAR